MRKLFIAAISQCCLLSVMTCQTAFAFNKPGDISITLGGGYDYLSDKRQMENTGIPFGIIGYNFTDHWGIEGLLGFFHTDSRRPVNYGKDVSGTMFAVDAVYHFSPYKMIQPYVLAGPGAMGFNPNGTSANNEGNINAAVGVQIFATEGVALRLEVRDFYTFVGAKNDVFLSGGVSFLIPT